MAVANFRSRSASSFHIQFIYVIMELKPNVGFLLLYSALVAISVVKIGLAAALTDRPAC